MFGLPYAGVTLLDSHCHVNELVYGSMAVVEQVIQRALDGGVEKLITIGSGYGLEAPISAVKVANRYSQVYATVGVHPYDALQWDVHMRKQLLQLATEEKVVAIGEM